MAGSDAFISYSHHADGDLAPALEAGLQRLAKPWNQRRAMEVFLDQQDLSASPHLWSSIVVALDQSEWFVLLASPGSAGSKWVGQEISHWLSVPERHERMLIVLTAGTLQWADGDFTDDSDAANPALRGVFEEEPLYVDMSQLDRSITLDLRNPLFKERVATLAATIRRTTVGDLIGEDTRQYQRARRLRRIAVGALAILTVGAVIASVVALQQRSEAQSQRNEAESQRSEAESQRNEAVRQKAEADTQRAEAEKNAAESKARELAALALDTMADDPAVASLLAVEANYPNQAMAAIDVVEAQTAVGITLRNAAGSTVRSVGANVPGDGVVAATEQAIATYDVQEGTFAPDGSLAPPHWWDAETGSSIGSPVGADQDAILMAPIGKRIPFTDFIVPPEIGTIPVEDPVALDTEAGVLYGVESATGDLIGQSASGDGRVTMRGSMPPGRTIFQLVVGPFDDVYGVASGGDVYRWSHTEGGLPEEVSLRFVRSITAAGRTLVAEVGSTELDGLGRPLADPFNDARLQVVGVDEQGYVVSLGLSDTTPLQPGSLTLSPDGRYLAGIAEGDGFEQPVVLWDMTTTRRLATLTLSQPFEVTWADNDRFVTVSARGVEQFVVVPRSVDVAVAADGLAAAAGRDVVAVTSVDAQGTPLVVYGTLNDAATPTGSYERRQFEFVSLDPTGEFVASSVPDQGDGRVEVRRVDDGSEVIRFDGRRVVAFSPAGSLLAIAGFEGLEFVDTSDWSVARSLALPDEVDGVADVSWSSDGRHLLVSGYEFETPWLGWVDVDRGDIALLPPIDASALAVAPSTSIAAIGSTAGEVRLFGLDDVGFELSPVTSFAASSGAITSLSFSPDGSRLVVSSLTSTTVWDVTNPLAARRLQVVTELPRWSFRAQTDAQIGGIRAEPVGDGAWGYVAYRPDGRSFVMAGPSGMVEVPDFDPRLACALASPRDLEAVAAILDGPSACQRVPGLMN